ncbi:MAG TPA: hypothetical protein VME40_08555 [Caulobacteraceae bacterium]|nr:hypothetical protein [Caulobacteraceae bacterium]
MRSYRFARFDAGQRLLGEVSLDCLNDQDALLVGGRLGWRVEVWDHGRPVGVAGEGAAEAPEMSPAAPRPEPTAFNPFSRRAWRRRRER